MKIAKVLGTDELFPYLEKYEIELDSHYDGILGRYPRKEWNKFITPETQQFCSDDALNFLDGLLRYDHATRLTAKQAMDHRYFGALHFFSCLVLFLRGSFSLFLVPLDPVRNQSKST